MLPASPDAPVARLARFLRGGATPLPNGPVATSRWGARVWAEPGNGGTLFMVGTPRRGRFGVDPWSMRGAALDAIIFLGRALRAEGVSTRLLRESTAAGLASLPSLLPVAFFAGDPLDPAAVVARLVEVVDELLDGRVASLRLSPGRVVEVTVAEAVEEARRQEAYQLPRRTGFLAGQTPEQAARFARGTTRIVEADGVEGGGYLLAEVPVPWLQAARSHVDEDRSARLDAIGGSRDPAFSSGWSWAWAADGSGAAGPSLSLLNGNNRAHYARGHGWSHLFVYVTRHAWGEFTGAIAAARRLALR